MIQAFRGISVGSLVAPARQLGRSALPARPVGRLLEGVPAELCEKDALALQAMQRGAAETEGKAAPVEHG